MQTHGQSANCSFILITFALLRGGTLFGALMTVDEKWKNNSRHGRLPLPPQLAAHCTDAKWRRIGPNFTTIN